MPTTHQTPLIDHTLIIEPVLWLGIRQFRKMEKGFADFV